ncbi:MAG: YlqF/YawG family GTPase [Christensenellales bacterium]
MHKRAKHAIFYRVIKEASWTDCSPFPGTRGIWQRPKRQLETQLKRVDIVLELCDARLPLSSRNPALDEMLANKPRLLMMNKEDLADSAVTRRWEAYFRHQGIQAFPMQAGKNKQRILKLVDSLTAEKRKRAENRGIAITSRAMVVGVPNVGKKHPDQCPGRAQRL